MKSQRALYVRILGVAALAVLAVAGGLGARNMSRLTAPLDGTPQRKIVALHLDQYLAGLTWLNQNGYEVLGVDYPKQNVDVLLDFRGEKTLVQALPASMHLMHSRAIDTSTAPDAKFQTPEKIDKALHAYAAQYPNLTMLKSAGKSLQGRDIWVIKISKNPKIADATKPKIFFDAMHHAREVMTSEIALDTIDYLLTNYGKIAKVTHWVDSNEIWVMPMFNVDGNNLVWTKDNMWRKNARGDYGVDINRNYPYKWSACDGSSDQTYAQDYHGEAAASEPETNVMMSIVKEIRPVLNISYHSYSELVLYAYGCEDERSLEKEALEKTGKDMAALLPRDGLDGTYTPGTPWETLYPVDGGSIDWFHHDMNVYSYVIEVNSTAQGFQPAYASWRDKTVTKLRAAWGFMLDRAESSGIRGIVRNSQGKAVEGASVTVENLTNTALPKVELQSHADGTFHVLTNPGKYRVTVEAAERNPVVEEVTVEKARIDLTATLLEM